MNKPTKEVISQQSILNSVQSLLEQATQLLQVYQQTAIMPAISEEPSALIPQQELMDVAETAKVLGISQWSLRDSVRRKTIPHVRIRSRIFFRKRELDAWISQGMSQGIGR